MKNLQLFEKYIESTEYRIKSIFQELQKNINDWFVSGELSKQNASLTSNKVTSTNFNDKSLILDFSDQNYKYQVIFIISMTDVLDDDKIQNGYIKVKMYDYDDNLLRTMGKDVKIKDFTEAKVIEFIAKIQSESKSLMDESPETLSDEETNLSDNIF